jgi:predicted nucleotidyltransferase
MGRDVGYFPRVDRSTTLKRLKEHEAELRAMGVIALSLFGSVARDEAGPESDVDVAVRLDHARGLDLLDFAEINLRLSDLLGATVDLISEPARKPRFQAEIDRDRVHAF